MGMTEQQAIETIAKIEVPSSADIPAILEAFDIMKKATEKQIPQKPWDIDEKQDGLFYVINFMCPTCNTSVIGQPYKSKYCKHCGQRLDWRNEDAE